MKSLNEKQRKWLVDAHPVICGGKAAPELALAGAIAGNVGAGSVIGMPEQKRSAGPTTLRFDSDGEGTSGQATATLDRLEIDIIRNTLPAGDHEQFSVTAYYVNAPDRILPPNEVTWHTSAPDIVSVDSSGVAIAKSTKGTSTIKATLDGKKSNEVTVSVVVLESIFVEPPKWQMRGGEKKQFEAMGVFSGGSLKQRLNTSLTWTVSNPNVLDINKSTGAVTAKHVTDKAAVKVTDSTGRISGSATVSVTTLKLKSLAITPHDVSLIVGVKQTIKVMGKFSEGPDQEETEAVRWETSHPNIITLDGKGGVTANTAVSGVTITVRDANDPNISDTAHVGMIPNEVIAISITPDSPTIPLGGFQQFTAWGDFADDRPNEKLDGKVTWSSSNEKAIHMHPDGNAYARASGDSTITAKYVFKDSRGGVGTVKGETKATVPSLKSISIEPVNESIPVGGQRRLKVMGQYDGGKADEVSGIEWSDDGKFARVDRNGVVTGRESGVAIIKAVHKSSSKDATIKIKVTEQVLKSIRIDTDNLASFDGTIIRGQRRQFRAIGVYPLGSGKEDTRPLAAVDWDTDSETVLKIDNKGLATALAVGNAMISTTDKKSQLETFMKIRVTESDGSTVSTADKGKLPEVVVKPYDAAKTKYQDLLVQVRQLDGIPKLIQTLDSIKADISKNAKRQTVAEAKDAKGQQLLLKSIDGQIDAFKASAENAKNKIAASESDLEIFKDELEVKELRKKSVEQKKKIDHALEAVKIGNNAAKDPVEAVVDFVKVLIDIFEVDTYTKQADALEKKLTAATYKNLIIKIVAVKTDLANAKNALDKAQALLKETSEHIADLRRTAEDHFDVEADQTEKKGGKKINFRFSQLNKPLDIANKIVSTLAPNVRNSAETAHVAISKFIKERQPPRDSAPEKPCMQWLKMPLPGGCRPTWSGSRPTPSGGN